MPRELDPSHSVLLIFNIPSPKITSMGMNTRKIMNMKEATNISIRWNTSITKTVSIKNMKKQLLIQNKITMSTVQVVSMTSTMLMNMIITKHILM